MGNCNVYDIRQYNYNFTGLYTPYLNSNTTKDNFGIPSEWTFYPCNDKIYADFLVDDIMRTKLSSIVYLLDNVRVLLYNG